MAGYWRSPEASDRALAEGWLHTGDRGFVDDQGRLHVVGREVERIVTGGENVDPLEVESVLEGHPDVAECAVVGVADAEWGQTVVAAVVLGTGVPAAPTDLEGFARKRLAGYKVPRRIVVVPSLPHTASGKIRRSEVRRQMETGA
jgi:acyl-CoA synthetase (AMP-forming)/AMP-acid ligase II